jgi:hypothetical protein
MSAEHKRSIRPDTGPIYYLPFIPPNPGRVMVIRGWELRNYGRPRAYANDVHPARWRWTPVDSPRQRFMRDGRVPKRVVNDARRLLGLGPREAVARDYVSSEPPHDAHNMWAQRQRIIRMHEGG